MKILTNIQTSQLGGIGQTLHSLISTIEKDSKEKVKIVGIDLKSEPNSSPNSIYKKDTIYSSLKIIRIGMETPYFGDVLRSSKNIDGIKSAYSQLIEKYISIIKKEKPSLILINGTYFVPWSLYQAGKTVGVPMVLHYHGILSKETSHYDPELYKLVQEMERTFDSEKLLYIFPSELAKLTVEQEVFCHEIAKSAVIPNSIPKHFFDVKNKGNKSGIAYVGRWSMIKNPEFMKRISNYDKRKNDNCSFNMISHKESIEKDFGKNINDIKIYGSMDSENLANFYGQMGMVLSPSHFETYGNVAQEALATGTPALVGPNMGIAQTFRDIGLSKYIVNFKSTKDVYEKIQFYSGEKISKKVLTILRSNLTPNKINRKLMIALKSV